MPLPVRHVRWLLLLLLLPFSTLGGAVAAGRVQLRLAGEVGCVDVVDGGSVGAVLNAACAAPAASVATLLAGALVTALVVAYATVNLTRLRA